LSSRLVKNASTSTSSITSKEDEKTNESCLSNAAIDADANANAVIDARYAADE